MSAPDDARELAALARGVAAHLARRARGGRTRTAAPSRSVRPGSEGSVDAPEHRAARRAATEATARSARPSAERPEAAAGRAATPTSQAEVAPRARGPQPAGVEANERAARAAPDLAALKELVAGCRACSLCETRTQTVFADGPEGGTRPARVMFVGEAPGQHEDEQGVPFVGRAGQLLTDIVEKGMGLRRADVYIANVLKCRPPGNRDPEPEEKALCTPFLDRQIELVAPEVILPLGLHATRHLLRSTASMGRLRGRVHERDGVRVVPTYHPAFLLRTPAMKKECWKDVQVAMKVLGLEVPQRPSRPDADRDAGRPQAPPAAP